jgi:pyocin large subunit-like protein
VAGRYTDSGNQGFKSQIYLKKHFNKHNVKFDPPFANEQEYEQAGIEFMSENGENTPDDVYQACFYRPSHRFHGDLVRYDERRNIFGMKTKNGFLRTFYPPRD